MGVGRSNERNAAAAGRTAAEAALTGRSAELAVVFCSDGYDLQALLDGINETTGGAPLIGCSTAGEIATDGPGEAGVVVTALGGPGFSVRVGIAEQASADLRGAGARVAGTLKDVRSEDDRILLLLTDGLAGDQQEVVRGAYSVAGAAVPLVGGCAGDDLQMRATHQLFGSSVHTDAVVGAAISSDGVLGIGVRHGWREVGDPVLVTSSTGNRVHTLDDQPALDVYLDRLGAPEGARTDPQVFVRFAMTHPLGLSRRSGEPHVRFIAEADFDERDLVCIAEVPQGGTAWFMQGDESSVLAATDAACSDALAGLTSPPLGLLAFDCIARKGVLGEEGITTEVARISEHADGAPVAGFYTYGEIARTRGLSGFHNQTLVVLAVG